MVNDVTSERLRRLTRPRDGAGPVLSLYLGLDPSQVPTPPAREAAVSSLLHDARRCVDEHHDELSHADRVRLRDAIAELDRRLAPGELPAEGARGLAVFAPGLDADVEVLRLPEPIPNHVVLDTVAHVEPLVPLAARERWCVTLVNRSIARFYLGDEDELALTGAFDDDVHGQHDQGGWSQRRYEESVEQDVHRHLDRVAQALAVALVPRGLYDRLVLAGPQPLRAALEEHLPAAVRERVCGWVDLDLSSATVADVRAAASGPMHERRAAREADALQRVTAGGDRAAIGLPEVLRALHERRVETLLIAAGVQAAGARCPTCGLLAVQPGTCPADGSELEERPDLVEAAVAAAYGQDADVVVIDPDGRALTDAVPTPDGVAAVRRF